VAHPRCAPISRYVYSIHRLAKHSQRCSRLPVSVRVQAIIRLIHYLELMKETYKSPCINPRQRFIPLHKRGRTFFVFFLLGDPWRLYFVCRRFGTLCSIFIGGVNSISLPAYTTYEDGPECSETSVHKIQTTGNHPKEIKRHSEHGESLKSRIIELIKKCFI